MLFLKKLSNKGKKVVVGMSGGVDSSVAAAILKREGYHVIGVTFKTWPKEECGMSVGRACCNLEAITRARFVSDQLKIPYYVVDMYAEFKRDVIDYFCDEYIKGNTPNPCVVCNEKVKFGALLNKARALGASFVATGHFALSSYNKKLGRYLLREGKDKAKDQSYFLNRLSQEQLKAAIFPLGKLTKDNVRALAKRWKLKTFNTVSSQDICFVQDQNYAEYIRKRSGIEIKCGDIVSVSGRVLGRHKGIPFYTIGQRRGLGIQSKEPLYVTAIDAVGNRVIVGQKKDVLKSSLIACDMNWIAVGSPGTSGESFRAFVKIRYNHKKVPCVVTMLGDGTVRVDFDSPQEAPTPGQAVVFYRSDIVLGGGWIKTAI
jgi:tRNA-specific 2-thiouridylase